MDDFRINDTTTGPGSYPNNTWMGDLRVDTLFAISNGPTIDFTPTPNTNANYQNINNTGSTALGSTYNSTSTAGNEDEFNFQTLTGVITEVIAVQIRGGYLETDSASHTMQQFLTILGTQYAGSTWTLASTMQFFSDLFAVNPNTGASWTVTEVNDLLAGYKMLS
jgi:hypothetical protein